jgi:hypothetical protein
VRPGRFVPTTITGEVVDVQPQRMVTVDRSNEEALSRAASGCLLAIPRAIALTLGILFSRLRFLTMAGMRSSPSSPLAPVQYPVTPFRVETTHGQMFQCTLRGELHGGAVFLGDTVEATGRLSARTNVLEVSQLRDLTTGAVTVAKLPRGARSPGLRGLLRLALAAFFVLLVLSILF